ncbi:MAG: DUF2953 domain-containing protein [Butyribacter sp.]|jgi:hypothetical protein|uniref:DUF2953 domain-containing protein n=1 Tax=Butyribacter TaxID=2822463 RepID=UPI00033CB336|nr:DUF2953 domain-containing protein [Clostridium sp.]MCQ5164443.1 DUF2953 domain-containing protein [Roseburia hominis]OKZ80062.1 MAG: hypothetical protein BHW08_08260 [Clostridium sp. CAG:12237_41]CCZ42657.1 putative uncharacterized protein [Clostridium sp. CAG:122]
MFFTILAIIGKILLTILKILLFLLLLVLFVTGLVLFVPVRYDFSGSYHGNDIRAECEASWLIHFISLRFWYRDGKTPYILRIAGIKILPGKIKEKQERKGKQKAGAKHKNKKTTRKSNKTTAENESKDSVVKGGKDFLRKNDVDRADTGEEKLEDVQKVDLKKDIEDKTYPLKTAEREPDIEINENKENIKPDIELGENKTETKKDIKQNKKNNKQKNKDKQKKSLWKNIVSKLKGLMQIPKKIADTFKKVSDAVKKIFAAVRSGKEKAVLVKEFVFGRECLDFVCVVRDNVLHLWRHIKPKLLRIDMTIGFDDPAVTGQVLGVIAAFCGAAGIMPCVTPDFEKRVFESDIEIKGRVTVFVLLKILIKVYFCEELKEFKKSYKSIREVL